MPPAHPKPTLRSPSPSAASSLATSGWRVRHGGGSSAVAGSAGAPGRSELGRRPQPDRRAGRGGHPGGLASGYHQVRRPAAPRRCRPFPTAATRIGAPTPRCRSRPQSLVRPWASGAVWLSSPARRLPCPRRVPHRGSVPPPPCRHRSSSRQQGRLCCPSAALRYRPGLPPVLAPSVPRRSRRRPRQSPRAPPAVVVLAASGQSRGRGGHPRQCRTGVAGRPPSRPGPWRPAREPKRSPRQGSR